MPFSAVTRRRFQPRSEPAIATSTPNRSALSSRFLAPSPANSRSSPGYPSKSTDRPSSVTSDDKAVLHLEDAGDFTRPDFSELAVGRVVDDAQQHGSPVLHDDVDRIGA